MKQSKWNKKRVSHYRPVKDCKRMNETFGEICLECNDCKRWRKMVGREWINKIHLGNTLEILKQMPSDFIDTIATSPPYW